MNLLILGAGGRMGRSLVRAVSETNGAARVSAALERDGSQHLGEDAGALAGLSPLGVPVTADLDAALALVDGVLDFTAPAFSAEVAGRAASRGLVHVLGTTGLSPENEAAIAAAASGARIVKSGNMSLGVNLLAALVEEAARALPPGLFDLEIIEMHHRHKVDAPSGTALLLGEAAAAGRGVDFTQASVRVRDGHTGPRVEGTIGFATLRGGSVVGDHSVILAGEGESVTLSHHAADRMIFARGAVRAALWAAGKPAGLYSMRDVLGLA
ncbi:4-hydroxy-tetrahydrodipicolinate reductase [Antarcticirhabdus aurantiaca]|uniref:4-hydroxy-tetrahydrodipicolinate reductase n=1 Tax=Antarcticirhabdus aurantiaca TaxID=2606717 RepID=A0ACD4NKK8_9HYPH|nr:4-hydroxy-tetrahydrodipicolinate reductase [Antarcticirhabdus aurantiaca]WAJ27211.1 4-hydroxy-tetrahydrodipicolinate reductase [Jeongeuplla avenae]